MNIEVSFGIAFAAGILTFFTPCFFPLVPAYLTYMTGVSLSKASKFSTLVHALFFILGFSVVYLVLGTAAGLLGSLLAQYNFYIRLFGGILIILFGLNFLGVFKLPFIGNVYQSSNMVNKPGGYLGSFVVGIVFATGWSPCIGPILASIFLYASQTETLFHGIGLFVFYSLGLAIPLLISALAVDYFLSFFTQVKKYLPVIEKVCGIFLILMGFLLIGDYFMVFSQWLNRVFNFQGI